MYVYTYTFFIALQKVQNEASSLDSDRGKKGGKGKTKSVGTRKATTARKESRTYSSLIFAMEQFEKNLIRLDKKTRVSCLWLTRWSYLAMFE